MSRVYAVQDHKVWSVQEQKLVSKYDLSPASEYGEINYLVGNSLSPFNPEAAVKAISQALDECKFSEDDYLLMVGNPCIIAWTAALAADMCGGRLRLLQWSGKERRYTSLDAQLWDDGEDPDALDVYDPELD